jgi:hypothetical protein
MQKPTPTERIYQKMRDNRDADGAAVIETKDVATLVRAHLRRVFPGIKFSVRRSGYDAINVGWTDGPPQHVVGAEAEQYSFGGFDGSIDLAYSSKNWLLPDGTMEAAASEGTEGSMGRYESYVTDCPQPGAVLVKFGPKYLSVQKELSPGRMRELVEAVAARRGITVDHNQPYWAQTHDGEYLTTLAWQWDQEVYEGLHPEEASP